MAVEDHEVHPMVQHSKVVYGCWNKPRTRKNYKVIVKVSDDMGYYSQAVQEIPSVMSILCRNTGHYSKDPNGHYSWKDDPSCEGCNPLNKDHEYIERMRRLVEREV
jgi:hypothetical protein